jgi:putative transposase
MSNRKPRGPKPEKVFISQKQAELLSRLIKRPSTAQKIAQRARIIQKCACDVRNQHIAEDEKVTVNTVKKWRGRWLEAAPYLTEIETEGTAQELEGAVAHLLADHPRRGSPGKFSAEQICQIIALACEPPEEYGRPVTHWTPPELADEAVKQGFVESISARQAGRFLKRSRSQTTSIPVLVAE